jgi:hypothetical protein
MMFEFEKEIEAPTGLVFEITGRALVHFAQAYPKNDEVLWWKLPGAIKTIAEQAYRKGYADGAGIKLKVPDGPMPPEAKP